MKKLLSLSCLLFSGVVFAAHQYDCYPTKDSSYQEKMRLDVLSSKTVELDGHKLTLDATYRPRLNKNYRRFDGDTSFLTSESYAIDVLVHVKALDGESKASMKILARGEGFFNDYFACYLR